MNTFYVIPPDGPATRVDVAQDQTADMIGHAVGGYFQAVPLASDLYMWLNEDGKGLGLPWNFRAQTLWNAYHGADTIVGTIVVTGGADSNGNTLGVPHHHAVRLDELLAITGGAPL